MQLFLSSEINSFLGGYCYSHNEKLFTLVQNIIYEWCEENGFKHECRKSKTRYSDQTVCLICGRKLKDAPKIKVKEDGKVWK